MCFGVGSAAMASKAGDRSGPSGKSGKHKPGTRTRAVGFTGASGWDYHVKLQERLLFVADQLQRHEDSSPLSAASSECHQETGPAMLIVRMCEL